MSMKEDPPTAPYEKAIEESAKAVQKATDAGRELGAFAKLVLGPGFVELGGAFADWAAVYRYERAVELAHRVGRAHKRRGIEGRAVPIPPRLGIPLLQQATLEDNHVLVDMWSALIANATDPDRATEARRSYCGLLSSMEPLDALVLKEVYRWRQAYPDRNVVLTTYGLTDDEQEAFRSKWPNIKNLEETLASSESNLVLSLENLERLGLIFDYMPRQEIDGEADQAPLVIPGQMVPVTHEIALLDLTHTGVALMVACSD
jgi:hypothetical protein